MKVGTDGTLLGAWARGGRTVLDIGTGTGLIALMMAQRFPDAHVTGIDIDPLAVSQAIGNVGSSPFGHVTIMQADARGFDSGPFEAIVCNPPFFTNSLVCPDGQRTLARHTTSLSFADLMVSAWRLLDDAGEFSVVIPFDCKGRLEAEAAMVGFFKSRECAVKTTPRKSPRRFLLAFRKHACECDKTENVLETAPNVRSPWYQQLTQDFYL